MATAILTPPSSQAAALQTASDALLQSLKLIGAMSAITTKLQEELQGMPGVASGLADALDTCLDTMHGLVAPARELAFNATGAARQAGTKAVQHDTHS